MAATMYLYRLSVHGRHNCERAEEWAVRNERAIFDKGEWYQSSWCKMFCREFHTDRKTYLEAASSDGFLVTPLAEAHPVPNHPRRYWTIAPWLDDNDPVFKPRPQFVFGE